MRKPIEDLEKLLSELKFDHREYAPHSEVKRKCEKISAELNRLIDKFKKEGLNIDNFLILRSDFFHTMDREYSHCEFTFEEKKKSNATKKSKADYIKSINILLRRIRQDFTLLDFYYEQLTENNESEDE